MSEQIEQNRNMNPRKIIIKEIVLDVLFEKEQVQFPPSQFGNLISGIAEVMIRRKIPQPTGYMPLDIYGQLSEGDLLLAHEIFWDLVYSRVLTIGLDASNLDFPWFRLHSEAATNLK